MCPRGPVRTRLSDLWTSSMDKFKAAEHNIGAQHCFLGHEARIHSMMCQGDGWKDKPGSSVAGFQMYMSQRCGYARGVP
jgi:hypothetical protein